MTLNDYARAIANLAWHTGHQCNAMPTITDLDRIIASVPAPEPQHHAAPTLPAPDVQALDCGCSACRFAKQKGGMRTNGGCRCFERAGFAASAVEAAYQMLPEIMRLRGNVQAQIDAAVAREREEIVALAEREMVPRDAENFDEADHGRNLGLSDLINEIRARSGAKGQ